MPVEPQTIKDPAGIEIVQNYTWDDERTYCIVMGVGPDNTNFAPFQFPIEYDMTIADVANILEARTGIDATRCDYMAGSDYRPLDARLGTVFGERFLKKWHCQVSIYPKGWKPEWYKDLEERGIDIEAYERGEFDLSIKLTEEEIAKVFVKEGDME